MKRGAGLAALALLAGCASVHRLSHEASQKFWAEPDWRSVQIGLGEDYREPTRSLARAKSDLAAARAAGVTALRIGFPWDAIESQAGTYDWSFWDDFVRAATTEYGLQLVPYVAFTPRWAAKDPGENFLRSPPRDPQDFGRFMHAIVTRYRDVIHTWELWSEPDNSGYWLGSVPEYAALVRAGAAAVHVADPSARVVLGGIGGDLTFLEKLFRDEQIARAVDVVNLHSYFETWRPDAIERLGEYIERAAAIVREYGEGEPVWLAEAGYSSVGPRAKVSDVYAARFQGEHTADAQAIAVARTCLIALHTGRLDLLAWSQINDLPPTADASDDNQRHLGIRQATGEPKPASAALAQMARLFAEPYTAAQIPVKILERSGGEPVVCAFAMRSGRYVIAAWMGGASSPPPTGATVPVPDTRHGRVAVRLPLRARIVALSNARAMPLPPERVTVRGDRATFDLRGAELVVCVAEP